MCWLVHRGPGPSTICRSWLEHELEHEPIITAKPSGSVSLGEALRCKVPLPQLAFEQHFLYSCCWGGAGLPILPAPVLCGRVVCSV